MTQFAGIPLRNTADLLDEHTRIALLLIADYKQGKTTCAATLDKLTQKFYDKPSLFIAVEAGEGGGTASIQEAGVSYVLPNTKQEFDRILAELSTDKEFGGVILDSTGELVRRFIFPYALTFPSREKVASRAAGVPERSDYQTAGEVLRGYFNQLINLTTLPNVACRKHVIVTALKRIKIDEDTQQVLSIGPDLPGAMASTAGAMFQTIGYIESRADVIPNPDKPGTTMKQVRRVLVTSNERNPKLLAGDRFKIFPGECEPDLAMIWEKYALPRLHKKVSV